MERIINKLIDDAVANVDTYTNNGSTWLIFTDDKRWVIELTKDGTLWYNYNFFNNLFTYTSMDVIENQHYITKWVENNVINGVKDTEVRKRHLVQQVKDTIQNGVKETELHKGNRPLAINDTIQHGVKDTKENWSESKYQVEETIQNGVKETSAQLNEPIHIVEDTIQNGVKQTELSKRDFFPKDIIQDGVKHTEDGDWLDGDERIGDIIENGVKDKQYTNKR